METSDDLGFREPSTDSAPGCNKPYNGVTVFNRGRGGYLVAIVSLDTGDTISRHGYYETTLGAMRAAQALADRTGLELC